MQITYEEIKRRWLRSPCGEHRTIIVISDDAADDLDELDERYWSVHPQRDEDKLNGCFPPSIKEGNVVEFRYQPYKEDPYAYSPSVTVSKQDPEFVNYLYDTYSQYMTWVMGAYDQ